MRVLLDCTMTCRQPELMTGIQRVVHEIVRRCRSLAPDNVECLPVRFAAGAWRPVGDRIPGDQVLGVLRAAAASGRARRKEARVAIAEGRCAACLHWLFGQLLYTLASALCSLVKRVRVPAAGEELVLRPGDTLVLLDTFAIRPEVIAAQRAGARVEAVIHDIIPITHPHFFVGGNADLVRWFDWSANHASRLHATTEYVRGTLRGHYGAACPEVRVFPLGADLPLAQAGLPRPALAHAVGDRTFLMVGTLEPRKGHACALDAFELCWARGSDARLLVLGRVGWMTEALVRRMRSHPELGRRLHVFHDADDADLAHAYRGCRALVAASAVEGFGLPLVEAAQHGLPVLASDIPVFREVASDATYFRVDDAGDLARAILSELERSPRRLPGRRWVSWEESVRRLLRGIVA